MKMIEMGAKKGRKRKIKCWLRCILVALFCLTLHLLSNIQLAQASRKFLTGLIIGTLLGKLEKPFLFALN